MMLCESLKVALRLEVFEENNGMVKREEIAQMAAFKLKHILVSAQVEAFKLKYILITLYSLDD